MPIINIYCAEQLVDRQLRQGRDEHWQKLLLAKKKIWWLRKIIIWSSTETLGTFTRTFQWFLNENMIGVSLRENEKKKTFREKESMWFIDSFLKDEQEKNSVKKK